MNKLFIFGLGAAAGSLLTWKILDEKYKRLADEEIEVMKEYYEAKANVLKVKEFKEKTENPSMKIEEVKDESKNTITKHIEQKKPITYYYDKVQALGYDITPEDNVSITEEEDGSLWMGPGTDYIDPYVIPPEEFGEIESYDTKSWTYYKDSVITDDMGEIVYEPESIIGSGLNYFGEYEDDSVHVRNENLECDYEIIKIDKAFKELNGRIDNDISPRS